MSTSKFFFPQNLGSNTSVIFLQKQLIVKKSVQHITVNTLTAAGYRQGLVTFKFR